MGRPPQLLVPERERKAETTARRARLVEVAAERLAVGDVRREHGVLVLGRGPHVDHHRVPALEEAHVRVGLQAELGVGRHEQRALGAAPRRPLRVGRVDALDDDARAVRARRVGVAAGGAHEAAVLGDAVGVAVAVLLDEPDVQAARVLREREEVDERARAQPVAEARDAHVQARRRVARGVRVAARARRRGALRRLVDGHPAVVDAVDALAARRVVRVAAAPDVHRAARRLPRRGAAREPRQREHEPPRRRHSRISGWACTTRVTSDCSRVLRSLRQTSSRERERLEAAGSRSRRPQGARTWRGIKRCGPVIARARDAIARAVRGRRAHRRTHRP